MGRSRASTPAIAASPTIMVMPRVSRRAATIPAMPARTSTTTSTEPIRIGLSAVPKVRIAHSLTGVGVRSMTVEPTASTGEAAGTVRAATRWAAAIPTRVARTPYRAWSSRPRVLVITHDLGLGGGQLDLHDLLLGLVATGWRASSPARGVDASSASWRPWVPVLVTGSYDAGDAEAYESPVRQIAAYGALHGCRVALANTLSAFAGVDAAQRLGVEVVWALHESFPLRHFWRHAYGAPVSPRVKGRAETAPPTRGSRSSRPRPPEMSAPLLTHGESAVVPRRLLRRHRRLLRAGGPHRPPRRGLGFAPDTLVLACVGRIEPRKAQINIAQAFAGSRPSVAVTSRSCGRAPSRGGPREALEALVAGFGEARVRVEPVQPDTYRWYHAADVLVSGSDIESLPRSMIEAMGFGRPVASTAVFGIPELVTDGVDGFLCPSRDLDALRAMLERVVATPRDGPEEMGDGHARRCATAMTRRSSSTTAVADSAARRVDEEGRCSLPRRHATASGPREMAVLALRCHRASARPDGPAIADAGRDRAVRTASGAEPRAPVPTLPGVPGRRRRSRCRRRGARRVDHVVLDAGTVRSAESNDDPSEEVRPTSTPIFRPRRSSVGRGPVVAFLLLRRTVYGLGAPGSRVGGRVVWPGST